MHVWGLRLLAALFALAGIYSLYTVSIVWSAAGAVLNSMPREVWLGFALWALYAPLLLLTAWFCARRSRHALSVYEVMVLMWVSSVIVSLWQQGWQELLRADSLLLVLLGLALTVLPWLYLRFLRARNWLN